MTLHADDHPGRVVARGNPAPMGAKAAARIIGGLCRRCAGTGWVRFLGLTWAPVERCSDCGGDGRR